jgi:hypothetical protein
MVDGPTLTVTRRSVDRVVLGSFGRRRITETDVWLVDL